MEPETSFQTILDILLDEKKAFNPRYLAHLSDLDQHETQQLQQIWEKVSVRRRQVLLKDLAKSGEQDYLLFFEAVGRLGLTDPQASVRILALQALAPYENTDLIPIFVLIMKNDSSAEVRAEAAAALGKYVYLGELDEIPTRVHQALEKSLLQSYQTDDDQLVRRRALESLGYSSLDDVPALIVNAFNSEDKNWKQTALLAMGRSADERWNKTVLEMLNHPLPAFRATASRSAGELEISEATPRLIELAQDSDDDVRLAAIWSLSQIGGEGVRQFIEKLLEEEEGDELVKFFEEALDNLAFTEDFQPLPLYKIPTEDGEGDESAIDELDITTDEDELSRLEDETFEDEEDFLN